jgi:hypothetical protein
VVEVDDDIKDLIEKNDLVVYFQVGNGHGRGTPILCGRNGYQEMLSHYVWQTKGGRQREPEERLAYRDRNRANCRYENLYLVSVNFLHANSRKRANNRSGFTGVSRWNCRNSLYWRAQIKEEGKMIRGKLFPYTEEGWRSAARWYNEQFRALYPEATEDPSPDVETRPYSPEN